MDLPSQSRQDSHARRGQPIQPAGRLPLEDFLVLLIYPYYKEPFDTSSLWSFTLRQCQGGVDALEENTMF